MRLTPPLATLVLLAASGVARAQAAPATEPSPAPAIPADIAAELAGIRASLADIAALLKRQAEQTELSIMMKRVELQNFLLMETNRQLQSLRDGREAAESQLESLAEGMREMEEETPVDERAATGEDLEQARMRKRWKERMEREQAKAAEQVKKIGVQITELESQAASTRDDITRWQAMIDDWFEQSAR